jgi:hypothetical protein
MKKVKKTHKFGYKKFRHLLRELLNISEMLVQVSVDVGQLDDVGGVTTLKVFADDFAETLLTLTLAVLKKI